MDSIMLYYVRGYLYMMHLPLLLCYDAEKEAIYWLP